MELRLDELRRNFGAQIEFQHRFCHVFGDVPGKMAMGWHDKGGYEGFAEHVQHVAARFNLFGNVGYRIVEANIQELLREPNSDLASCEW